MQPSNRVGQKFKLCHVPLMVLEITAWDDQSQVWKGKHIIPAVTEEWSRYPETMLAAIESAFPEDALGHNPFCQKCGSVDVLEEFTPGEARSFDYPGSAPYFDCQCAACGHQWMREYTGEYDPD